MLDLTPVPDPAVADTDPARVMIRRLDGLLADRADRTDRTDLPEWDDIAGGNAGWAWLRASYRLTDTELDAVLLSLAPEVDLRYERTFARLQDDADRRRPTVDLILGLVSGPAGAKLAARALFRTDGALLAGRLLELTPDPHAVACPLLGHLVVVPPQIVDVVLGQGGLDRGLAHCCTITPPGGEHTVPLPATEVADLLAAAGAATPGHPLRLYVRGAAGSGRTATAAALATVRSEPLIELDLAAADDATGDDLAALLARVVREADLHRAVLHVRDPGRLDERGRRTLAGLLAAAGSSVTVLSGSGTWTPLGGAALGVVEVVLSRPDPDVRRGLWRRALPPQVPDALVAELADRFRFGAGPVADAAAGARAAAPGGVPTRKDLFGAARAQTRHRLADLARRIEPGHGWDDLVLPADTAGQLREICARLRHGRQVWQEWGFDRGRPLGPGRGVSALFAGPPGTGKTSAAEVLAGELGLDLYAIDLAAVVSKYIGETEKNLERIFTAASDADAVLLFDEADALFGKRSQVKDAHDRHANVETAYLLQRMEQYDGVAILATNLRQHLDDAFTRRLQFVLDFPFPGEADRRRIWQVCLPPAAPVADDADLDRLAREFRLSGGNIRNCVLHAAFLAAEARGPIGTAELLAGVRREHHKLGRVMPGSTVSALPGPSGGEG